MRANCSSPPQITGSHSLGRINSGAVGPEATEDLLPQFHHPTIAFREVVGEGHTQIGEKAQYILFADTQAQQQIMIDPPRRPRALPLPTARSSGLCLMERQAVGEDRVETSLDQHDEIRPQRYALLYARGWSHGRRAAADAASCASSPLVRSRPAPSVRAG